MSSQLLKPTAYFKHPKFKSFAMKKKHPNSIYFLLATLVCCLFNLQSQAQDTLSICLGDSIFLQAPPPPAAPPQGPIGSPPCMVSNTTNISPYNDGSSISSPGGYTVFPTNNTTYTVSTGASGGPGSPPCVEPNTTTYYIEVETGETCLQEAEETSTVDTLTICAGSSVFLQAPPPPPAPPQGPVGSEPCFVQDSPSISTDPLSTINYIISDGGFTVFPTTSTTYNVSNGNTGGPGSPPCVTPNVITYYVQVVTGGDCPEVPELVCPDPISNAFTDLIFPDFVQNPNITELYNDSLGYIYHVVDYCSEVPPPPGPTWTPPYYNQTFLCDGTSLTCDITNLSCLENTTTVPTGLNSFQASCYLATDTICLGESITRSFEFTLSAPGPGGPPGALPPFNCDEFEDPFVLPIINMSIDGDDITFSPTSTTTYSVNYPSTSGACPPRSYVYQIVVDENCSAPTEPIDTVVTDINYADYDLIYTICAGDSLEIPGLKREITCNCPPNPTAPCDNFPFNQWSDWTASPTLIDNTPSATVFPTQTTVYTTSLNDFICADGPFLGAGPTFNYLVIVENGADCSYPDAATETSFTFEGCVGDTITIPFPATGECPLGFEITSFYSVIASIPETLNENTVDVILLETGSTTYANDIDVDPFGITCLNHRYNYNFIIAECEPPAPSPICPTPLTDPLNELGVNVPFPNIIEHYHNSLGYIYQVIDYCTPLPQGPLGSVNQVYFNKTYDCNGNLLECPYTEGVPASTADNCINSDILESTVVYESVCDSYPFLTSNICQGDTTSFSLGFNTTQPAGPGPNPVVVSEIPAIPYACLASIGSDASNVSVTPNQDVFIENGDIYAYPQSTTSYTISVTPPGNNECPTKTFVFEVIVDEDCNTPTEPTVACPTPLSNPLNELGLPEDLFIAPNVIEHYHDSLGYIYQIIDYCIAIPQGPGTTSPIPFYNRTFTCDGENITCPPQTLDPCTDNSPITQSNVIVQATCDAGSVLICAGESITESFELGIGGPAGSNSPGPIAYVPFGCGSFGEAVVSPNINVSINGDEITFSPTTTTEYTITFPNTSATCPDRVYSYTVSVDGNCQISNPQIFTDYTWLNNLVDVNNCEGTTVSVYNEGTYSFVYVSTANSGLLYFEDGVLYCTDGPGFSCVSAYGLGAADATWSCGSVGGPNCSVDDILALDNVQAALADNDNPCGVVEIIQLDLNGETLFWLNSGYDPSCPVGTGGNSSVINCNGGFVCSNASGPDICSDAIFNALQNGTVVWTYEPSGNELDLENFPWLNNVVDVNNCCTNNSITLFSNGTYSFLYIDSSDECGDGLGTLYYQDGTLYCTDAPGFSCLDAYGINDMNSSVVWTCNGTTVDPCNDPNINCIQIVVCGADGNTYPNPCAAACAGVEIIGEYPCDMPPPADDVFTTFPWLTTYVNQTDCFGETVNVYDLGTYSFVYIQSPAGGKLYFDDGTFYCADAPGFSCLSAYGINDSDLVATWTCGNEVDPHTVSFEDFPWLVNTLVAGDCCANSFVYHIINDDCTFGFIYVESGGCGDGAYSTLYTEDGEVHCSSSTNFSCFDFYNFNVGYSIETIWTCTEGPLGLINHNDEHTAPPLESLIHENGQIAMRLGEDSKSNIEAELHLNVYPNPSNGQFWVNLDTEMNELQNLSIFDLQGRLIETIEVNSNAQSSRVSFDLSDQTPGIYLIELQSGYQSTVKRIVIK